MSRKILAAAAVVMGPLLGMSSAWATPCTSTTIAALEGGGSCTVGDKLFSNFNFTSTDITASQVSVSPDTTAPSGEIGLLFSTGALSTNSAGTSLDATITFTVTPTTPGALINDAYLAIAGSVTGNGTATVGETLYDQATGASLATLTATLPDNPVAGPVTFTPTQTVSSTKDALVIGGTGITSLSAIHDDFSETTAVPEPASLALFGTALVGLSLFRRRRKQV